MTTIQRVMTAELLKRVESSHLPFLQVLIGPRQTGKSTIIAQLAEYWKGSKLIESADGIAPHGAEWLEFVWQKALDMPGTTLLCIDEIQKVRGWSEVVKKLFDRDRNTNKLRVVLSGSASLTLQAGLTESLAGRYELVSSPHWGLDESHAAFGWDLSTHLKFGGYPAPAFLIEDVQRWRSFVRDSIIEPVLGRDLQTAMQIQKPALLRQLFSLVTSYPAQEISYQKLLGQIQDHGNVATIKHYLDILKGGFLIETLEKYSPSAVVKKGSSPKMIPMAPALIHAFSNPAAVDEDPEWRGRVFESAVGAHLLRTNCELYYWREGDSEVDFVAIFDRQVYGIEVKSGRRKRANGLIAFKKKFPKIKTLLLDWDGGRNFLAGPASLEALLRAGQ